MYSTEKSNIAVDMLKAFCEAVEALTKASLLQYCLHDFHLVIDNSVGNISEELNCLSEISQVVRNIVANTQALECKIHGLHREVENLHTYKCMKEVEHGALVERVQQLLIQIGKLEGRNLQYKEQQDALQQTVNQLEQTCASLQSILATAKSARNEEFLTIL